MASTSFAADLAALELLGLYTGITDAYIAMMNTEGSASAAPT